MLKFKFHSIGKEIGPFLFFINAFSSAAITKNTAGDSCYLVLCTSNRLRWLFMHLCLAIVSSSGCGLKVEVSEIPYVI
jgi:hypothetical protein